ncbi:hypothetical protein D8Y22_14070 [Salinadaptatus halalkaliphilus]|uniref:Outer membrane lipoprotein carrier protein LolA n=1 Tax=Salinadaptatus halalkaliphilus TaxID=2419781 RepID=A0A4S3TNR1_9EURY|nr:hypothetical protein [Salinadaptatus halalkaliphilus]THE64188.1 hypothetical protein D8Y22_14070 [Salinadaptatus halalkaliphilus]
MTASSRRPIVLVAIALALSIAGAVAITGLGIDVVGTDSDPDPDELVADVVTASGDVETLQATRTDTYEIHDLGSGEPRTGETTVDVWKRLPDQSRTEVIATNAPERTPGDVRVVDGSRLQSYDANQASMLVDDEWDGDAVSHWPVTAAELEDGSLETTYRGTDTIDDRETYVVDIERADNSTAGISLLVGDTEYALGDDDENRTLSRTTTWWIDVDAGVPIKERVVTEHDAPAEHVLERERDVRTVTYEDVRFNEDIDDDRFVIDPPDGTDVYEPATSFDVDTVPDADDAVPFTVQEPVIPDRFERVIVSAREFRGNTTVDLVYRDGDLRDGEEIFVRLSNAPFDQTRVIEDDVGPHDGARVTTGFGPGYGWDCNGVYYELAADDPDGDNAQFAMDLADSIDC